MSNIVILTGAGISAESGLGTFRDEDGLWAQHRIEDVATPDGFARDPARVMAFYNARRSQATDAAPNAAHTALATLEAQHNGDVLIVTQNVDDLHERAGSRNVLHMHGALNSALCASCGHTWAFHGDMRTGQPCPACRTPAGRPDVVWFGEIPYHMDEIEGAMARADVFVAIGTSGNVYPAAGFVQMAGALGLKSIEINLEPSETASLFDETHFGLASIVVPEWVRSVLG